VTSATDRLDIWRAELSQVAIYLFIYTQISTRRVAFPVPLVGDRLKPGGDSFVARKAGRGERDEVAGGDRVDEGRWRHPLP
jgi:hypothetical protein